MKNPVKLPSTRRLDYHYIIMQSGFWAMFAAVCAYQAALLLERGFTNSQVGLVIAVRCLAGIICQPLLGGFADRHPKIALKHIVTLSLGVAFLAGLALLFLPGMGLGGTLLIFVVIGGLEVSAYPLMDAMAIEYISAGVPIRYSLGRGVGSLAYAVVCILLGVQVGRMGVESVLVTHSALVVVELLLVATYPACPVTSHPEGGAAARPQSIFSLLKSNPSFALTLVGVLFGLTAVLPLSNFLVSIIHSRGGSDGNLGLGLFIMAACELPTAFVFQRLLRRFGSHRLLLVSMVFSACKAVALLCTFNLAGVYLAQPLQMLGYGLFTPASVYFVSETVPEADRVRGQTLMMVASNGLGGVLGSFMGGWALDAGAALPIGGANLMLVCCVACGIIGVLLVWLGGRRRAG